MPSTNPAEPKRKFFTAEEANKMLPLVKAIVGDIVDQYESVNTLRERLSAVPPGRRRTSPDVYTEELTASQADLDAQETRLAGLVDELTRLGVELKGPDGLCDFPSLRDDRPVYLCWRLGEPQVMHWHELNAGVAGRQPLTASPVKTGRRPF